MTKSNSYASQQIYPCFENQCTYDSSGHKAENCYDDTDVLKQQIQLTLN